jgi:hypothetical protein
MLLKNIIIDQIQATIIRANSIKNGKQGLVMDCHKMIAKKKSEIIWYFLLCLIVTLLFLKTVHIRQPWNHGLIEENHQWLTGSSLKFINNWLAENPIALKFGMLENPLSVEFDSLYDREPYPSYPPGSLLPLYALAIILSIDEITPGFIFMYNEFNQFFIAILMTMMMNFILRKNGYDYLNSFLLSTIAAIPVLFSPETLYYFHSVYFADQAVILPFVFFVILELVHVTKNDNEHSGFDYLQMIVMFWGALIDWLFFFIIFVVWIVRLFRKEFGSKIPEMIKKSIVFWLPYTIANFLFFNQLNELGVLSLLKYKFEYRTGIAEAANEEIVNFFGTVWGQHFVNGYGSIALYLFWLCVVIYLVSIIKMIILKTTNRFSRLSFLLITYTLLPCLMQMYFFRNHTYIHRFSVLKLSVPLTMMLILAPVLLSDILKINLTKHITAKMNKHRIFPEISYHTLIIIPIFLMFFLKSNEDYLILFPPADGSMDEISSFIKFHTDYEDIVFSYDFEIPANPPVLLARSQKRVYKINSRQEIFEKIENINKPFVINILSYEKEACIDSLSDKKDKVQIIENEKSMLQKIDSKDFIN